MKYIHYKCIQSTKLLLVPPKTHDGGEKHDFWLWFLLFILLFFFPLFSEGKRKGEKNTQSCGQMPCLSARPKLTFHTWSNVYTTYFAPNLAPNLAIAITKVVALNLLLQFLNWLCTFVQGFFSILLPI